MKTHIFPSLLSFHLSFFLFFSSILHKFWSSWAILEREKINPREREREKVVLFLCFFLEGLVVDLVLERESLLIEIEREREVVQNQQEING